MYLKPFDGVCFERLNGGKPILAPTEREWECGVTFNSAAVYLDPTEQNRPLIDGLLRVTTADDARLADGMVALHYRARPRQNTKWRITRSYVGLALCTPAMELLERYDEPVVCPGENRDDVDYLGIEDPRITRFGDWFYMVYCGPMPVDDNYIRAQICMARSRDLIHWEKLGPVAGGVNVMSNKDGVLMPDAMEGYYFLLHRPMMGTASQYGIHLAISDALDGSWLNCGRVMRAEPDLSCQVSWMGAGNVPIPLGSGRYLAINHTGNLLSDGQREYHLDAALLNMNRFEPNDPAAILEARIDRILTTETDWEIQAPFSDSVANVVFSCGTYVYGQDLYVVYGGGDTFILAARTNLANLVEQLEQRVDPKLQPVTPAPRIRAGLETVLNLGTR